MTGLAGLFRREDREELKGRWILLAESGRIALERFKASKPGRAVGNLRKYL